jgi:predicted TIM-barrel fold metal-dependent hydrolase
MNKPPVIDVWMQHPTLRFINLPIFESLRRWTGMETLKEEIPIDFTVAAMDQGGVDKGLICSWWGPQGAHITNDEVAGFVRRFPERLIGIASADLYRPMAAVRELRRCVRELGFKGLRIVQWLWDLPVTDRRYYPLFAECVELGIPVCLQVGHTGPLCPSEPGHRIPGTHLRVRSHRIPLDHGDDRRGDQAPQRLHRHVGLHGEALPAGTGGLHEDQRKEEGALRDELSHDHPEEMPGRP